MRPINSRLNCTDYPWVSNLPFAEGLAEVRAHLRRCINCQEIGNKFIRGEEGGQKIKFEEVRRWLLNGPTKSLEDHLTAKLLVDSLGLAILTVPTDNIYDQLGRIFYFEYAVAERNQQWGRNRSLRGHRPRIFTKPRKRDRDRAQLRP